MADVERGDGQDASPGPVIETPTDVRSLSLTVLAVVAIVAVLRLAAEVLIPIVFAVLVSYALDPLVTWLVRWRVPRPLAAALVLTAVVGATTWGGYALRTEASAVIEQLPQWAHRVRAVFEQRHSGRAGPLNKVQQAAKELETAAASAAAPRSAPQGVTRVQIEEPPLNLGDYLLAGSMSAVALGAQVVVVLFLALYLMASGDLYRRKFVRLAGPSFTEKKITVQILEDIDGQIARFLLVRTGISVFVSVATWLAIKSLGLEHAAIWGIAAGVLNVIPYLGSAVAACGVALAAFLQFGTLEMGALAGGLTIAVAVVEAYLVTPWATSRAAKMNGVAVFVGLLFWGWVWGIWGLLLSVPILMVTKAVCDRVEDLRPIGELLGD